MHTTESIQNIVSETIKGVNWIIEPAGLYNPIDYVMSLGGKRIRPTLLLLSTNLFSDDINCAINSSLGIEVFHNFTLLHDDIMDNASMRRNRPTVHKKWNENTAILSGDAMLIKAYEFIAQTPKKYLPQVLTIFSKTALEVCEGQQYDMDFENRQEVSADEYLKMIRLKTAVLLAASTKIGAVIGGASSNDADLLYQFGENIGLAFQLKDDFLDVYGDENTFGKKIGGDIISNKKTFLLITALEKANEQNKQLLKAWLQKKTFDTEEKIKIFTSIYEETHVRDICENKMNEFFERALNCLDKVSIKDTEKIEIKNLALRLMKREV